MGFFDPSAVAVKNGRFFGFPYEAQEAEILFLLAPWDVTTSYRDGTHKGPQAMLEASYQLDFSSPFLPRAWETKICSLPLNKDWLKRNKATRALAEKHIALLESGKKITKEAKKRLEKINRENSFFHAELEAVAKAWMEEEKVVFTVGGDHSVSYGPIKALSEREEISVLHIDAHADLRIAYEGFPHSHASIMHLVKELPQVKKIVQVGLRDVSPDEAECIENHPKIKAFYDWELKKSRLAGISWQEQCERILENLGEAVYISFDIDGLDPRYCPHTGTPVPGGLELEEVLFLFEKLAQSGRRICGADLVEVSPGSDDEWDANVGARILFQLSQLIKKSRS